WPAWPTSEPAPMQKLPNGLPGPFGAPLHANAPPWPLGAPLHE
ncbi:unnamed protein product, partial [Penicillium egyptiacum]